MASKIPHSDLFDFDGYQAAIKEVKASTADFGKSVEGVIDRISKSQAELTAQFREYAAQLKSLNVGAPSANSGISAITNQINQASIASREYKSIQASLADTLTLQKGSIKELEATYKSLKNQLASLKPSQADYAQQVGLIKGRLDLIVPAVKSFNTAIKGQKQVIDANQGSYKALSLEMARLKAQLQNLPNAFNAVTGNLNKQNKEAVALVGKIGTIDAALKGADASMGTYSRNVGNYTSAFSKGFGAIRQLAYLLPGIGLAGVFNLIFEGIEKVIDELDLFGGKTDDAQKALEGLQAGLKSDAYKTAIVNVATLRENIQLAKEGFISKEGVLKEYNETIGQTTGKVNTLNQAELELTKNGDAYVQMVLYKTAAQLSAGEAAQKMVDAAIKQQNLEKQIQANASEQAKAAARGDKEGSGLGQYQDIYLKRQAVILKQESDAAIKSASKIADDFQHQAAEIAKKFKFDFFGKPGKDKEDHTLENSVSAQEKRLKREYDSALKQQQSLLTEEEITQKEFEQRKYDLTVAYVQAAIAAELRLGKKANQDHLDGYIALLDDQELEREKREAKQFAKLKSGRRGVFDTAEIPGKKPGTSVVGDSIIPGLEKNFQDEIDAENRHFELIKARHKVRFNEEQEHLKKIRDITLKYKKDTTKEEQAIAVSAREQQKAINEAATQVFIQAGQEAAAALQDIVRQANDNRISDIQTQHDKEASLLDKQKERELAVAGLTAEQKRAIEADFNAKKEAQDNAANAKIKKIKIAQAKEDKLFAAFQIAINTAVAISRVLAEVPKFDFGVSTGILVAAYATLGAVELAAVLAKPLPKFRTGTDYAPKGLAIVNEEGPEIIQDRNGNVRVASGNLAMLQGGEKIYTHDASKKLIEDSIKYQAAHDIIASGNTQSRLAAEIRKGRDQHDIEKMAVAMRSGGLTESSLERVMTKVMKSLPVQENHYDERGYLKRIREINERRTYLNGR